MSKTSLERGIDLYTSGSTDAVSQKTAQVLEPLIMELGADPVSAGLRKAHAIR